MIRKVLKANCKNRKTEYISRELNRAVCQKRGDSERFLGMKFQERTNTQFNSINSTRVC